ncbi:hypothetical protein [Pseudarthrobacter sp. NIBRBAC000502770]|uniref:hypothetical protein n=1 Tax=Pseudarthrobacter sp. NIBRBAC000502770 TaxID=2590785 RepID=UPI0011408AB5|nr:hypothetical protein [Pseudarthrobacter sp. NIBRBAC000502770]QDG87134.1 hypothetical protein NIBR502770_00455 [Pseudarthrobacter sp. NIBRBAC000502770]
MKFKIGDHVRIIARRCRQFDDVGAIVDVVDGAHHPFRVQIQDQHPLWFGPHELVLAEAPAPAVTQ